jgi:purine-binding chemotaxis protein CheW
MAAIPSALTTAKERQWTGQYKLMSQLQNPVSTHKFAGKYLTFNLQGGSYGIQVLTVREIIRNFNITAVPQMPDYIRGVINLRGKIIPVMDLRRRFDFPNVAKEDQTCIIVAQVTLPDGKVTPMGLVVDGVEEVISLTESDIEEPPNFGGQVCMDYLLGIAKVKGVVKSLLDIDKVVGGESLPDDRDHQ